MTSLSSYKDTKISEETEGAKKRKSVKHTGELFNHPLMRILATGGKK